MKTIKNLSEIYTFIKVGEHQSFSKAADELGVSKSLLSKTIRELEEKMNRNLFKRNTRQVHFTELGRQYFDYYKAKVEDLEVFNDLLLVESFSQEESLKITLAGAYGEESVAEALAKVLKRYPRVKAQLDFSAELVDIFEHSYDLAIRVSRKRPTKGYVQQIASRLEYVCASPDYIERFGRPLLPRDLQDHNCLAGQQSVWHFRRNNKVEKIEISGNFLSTNGRAICSAAIGGLGVCKLPESYVLKHIQTGQLVILLDEFTEKEVPIWAITASKSSTSEVLKALIDQIKKDSLV
ncbi:MAG: LysR family transcriptional regulator [Bdellovibrionota bacterium]|nr:LysR family transcriptional regulator [Bdellovibrionota bacterium]